MSDIITDSAIMAALGRQMTRAVRRQMIAAGNLANSDTPGYQAQEISFASALDGQLGGLSLETTNSAHVNGAGDTGTGTISPEAGLTSPRRDGNNVQVDKELLTMGQAAQDFGAAQTMLAAKFRLVRYAINDGK